MYFVRNQQGTPSLAFTGVPSHDRMKVCQNRIFPIRGREVILIDFSTAMFELTVRYT